MVAVPLSLSTSERPFGRPLALMVGVVLHVVTRNEYGGRLWRSRVRRS